MGMTGKGIRYEWAVERRLRALGHDVIRASASHGTFDLVVHSPTKTGFFQCKSGRFECHAADSLLGKLPNVYGASVVVVHRCRATCRRPDYAPTEFCMHERPFGKPKSFDVEATT